MVYWKLLLGQMLEMLVLQTIMLEKYQKEVLCQKIILNYRMAVMLECLCWRFSGLPSLAEELQQPELQGRGQDQPGVGTCWTVRRCGERVAL